MPMAIFANEHVLPPRETFLELTCAACGVHYAIYSGGYISARAAAYAAGWRRRLNDWFFGSCVPKGSDDPE